MSNLLQDKVPDITGVQERYCKTYRQFDANNKLTLCLKRHPDTNEWVDVTLAEQERLRAIEIQLELKRAENAKRADERLLAYYKEHPDEVEEADNEE